MTKNKQEKIEKTEQQSTPEKRFVGVWIKGELYTKIRLVRNKFDYNSPAQICLIALDDFCTKKLQSIGVSK